MRADGGRRFLVGGKFVCPKEGSGKPERSLVKRMGQSHNHRNTNYNSESANFSINLGNRTEDAQIFEIVRKIRVPSTCINNVGP
jgi:hypothetical protein